MNENCSPAETFIKVKRLSNQLSANYVYYQNGKACRASCPLSGVVIAQQKNMPRKFWRDNPEHSIYTRPKLKHASKVEDSPFFEAYGIYRYKEPYR